MAEKKSLQSQYLPEMFVTRGPDQDLFCKSLLIVILEYSQHVMALISQSDVIITPHLANATPKVSVCIHDTILQNYDLKIRTLPKVSLHL